MANDVTSLPSFGAGVPPGGTTNQVLAKASATDFNTQWVNPGAGTGDVATDVIWVAKGDTVAATGPVAAVRVPVGTNGQVLTADSAEAAGVKWATPTGAVDSVFGRTGAVVAVSGDYTLDLIDAVDSNRMLLSDASGNGTTLSSFAYSPTNFNGEQLSHTVVPTNAGDYQTLHSHYASLNPTVADADQNWNMHFYEFSAGDDNSGNQVGDATNGSMFGLAMSLRSIQTSNVGNMSPFNAFTTLGNGTDPMTGRNITMYNANPSLQLGGVTIENMYGYNLSFNGQTGSDITNQTIGFNLNGGLYDVNQFFGFTQGVNFDGTVGDAAGFQSAHSFDDITNGVNTFADFNQQAGTIGNNYFSFVANPGLDTITGGYFGLSMNPNVTSCAYADGININVSGVTSGGLVRAAYFNGDVQIDGDLSFTGNFTPGQTNSFSSFTVVDGGGNPSSNNSFVTQMNAAGTVANCDTLGLNTAALISLDSTFAGTSGSLGIGLCSLALPNVVTMEAGATLDNMTACVYATVFDAANTGGTIDRLVGARSLAVSSGGTQTITRMYSFFADYFAGDVATDSWGFYDSGAKYNYIANKLKIGGADTTLYALEVSGESMFNQVGFYNTVPIAQPTSSGAATAGGTYGATEQAMLQEAYDALRALGLMS